MPLSLLHHARVNIAINPWYFCCRIIKMKLFFININHTILIGIKMDKSDRSQDYNNYGYYERHRVLLFNSKFNLWKYWLFIEKKAPKLPKIVYFHRPLTKLQEGNVFTHVCHAVHVPYTPPLGPDRNGHHTPLPYHKSGRYTSYWNVFLFYYMMSSSVWKSPTCNLISGILNKYHSEQIIF